MPGTPSISMGTRTPCQWMVVGSSSSLREVHDQPIADLGADERTRAGRRCRSRRAPRWPGATSTSAICAVMSTSTMCGIGIACRPLPPAARRRPSRAAPGCGRGLGRAAHDRDGDHDGDESEATEHGLRHVRRGVLQARYRRHSLTSQALVSPRAWSFSRVSGRAVRRGGRPRVVGPGMLGIAAAQLLADFWIGALPKTPQVAGGLHRAAVGGQQAEGHRHPRRAERAVSRPDRTAPAASPTAVTDPSSP